MMSSMPSNFRLVRRATLANAASAACLATVRAGQRILPAIMQREFVVVASRDCGTVAGEPGRSVPRDGGTDRAIWAARPRKWIHQHVTSRIDRQRCAVALW